jgi:glycosyltransferase involved in cell wall biosynthesis
VHAHEVKAAAYVAAARTTDRKYKLVTTNHGVRAKKAPTLRFYEWIYTHLIMRRFDRVLSVCSSDRKLLIDRGVPAAKVAVHLNGVDRPKISPELRAKESARIRAEWNLASLGIGPRSICLGLVGRLAPEKRHSYIMQAMKELRAAHSEIDAHLIIFGIGAMGDALKAESEALGLSDCVHWMGYRGTVGSEMAGFDVLVSLSSAEGLPVNLVEAGWAATPVFATAVDGNLDLVPSPEYGTLVSADASVREAAQKLAHTLSDPTALQKTGINLQRRIEELFSGVVWVERLKEFYR